MTGPHIRLRQAHAMLEAAQALDAMTMHLPDGWTLASRDGFGMVPFDGDHEGNTVKGRDGMVGGVEVCPTSTPGEQAERYDLELLARPGNAQITASLTTTYGRKAIFGNVYDTALLPGQEEHEWRPGVGQAIARDVVRAIEQDVSILHLERGMATDTETGEGPK